MKMHHQEGVRHHTPPCRHRRCYEKGERRTRNGNEPGGKEMFITAPMLIALTALILGKTKTWW